MAKVILLENGVADETGDAKSILKEWAQFSAVGTWDGATVTFEFSIDGSYWETARYEDGIILELTSDSILNPAEFLVSEYSVRAKITGGGASTNLTMQMIN